MYFRRMNKTVAFVFSVVLLWSCGSSSKDKAPTPPFMLSETKNETPTYEEGIAFWDSMSNYYSEIQILKYGATDAGLPLHIAVIDGERPMPLGAYKTSMKQTLLISNAIHAGEPDGVDASMLLAHALMTEPRAKKLLEHTTVIIIPFYNIGGVLNRNSTTRANQNGPAAYGFRGNAQNLDLNRDFVKCDSRNALSFATLINELDPDLYIETHVSNGADYPYTITYIPSQEDKIGLTIGSHMRTEWTPFITKRVASSGFKIYPYINVHGVSPENGFGTFYDKPRYSTGFLSLRQTPGYITETHMLKPYQKRVEATYEFLMAGVELLARTSVRAVVDQSRKMVKTKAEFPLDWSLDSTQVTEKIFEGYKASYKTSEVTGAQRLYYDRKTPTNGKISYYPALKPIKTVTAPDYYILKKGFKDVEERLRANGVKLVSFGKDTTFDMEVYHIDTFSTVTKPFEKHYYHYNTHVTSSIQKVAIHSSDWLIKIDNLHRRFIIEVLEPTGPDSYFNWNFFDAVLQQKEWYSAYVFEDEAADLLKNDEGLKQEFLVKKQNEPQFANNPQAQLYWIYKHSSRYEKEHLRYPVFRGIVGV
ncbi:MAG: hypothetical protein ACI9JN_000599 [Bacteroidia bacterium]|jgi:hypothetical protein